MVTKVVPGLLIATADHAEVAREACARIVRAIREALKERGTASIALSGGSSPLPTYRLLAKESLDWSRIHIFWVDERAVPKGHERSNYAAAKAALLDAIVIPEANVHRMRGEAESLEAEAERYAELLRDTIAPKASGVPVIDVVVLGIGDDGHTASLFPGDPTVHLTDRLVAYVPAKAGREARLTLSVPVLENAKASVLIVLGKSKHVPLERIWAVSGDVATTPARIVRSFRGSITWVIDRAAGGIG
jgi:6-phosphogluconolactonase